MTRDIRKQVSNNMRAAEMEKDTIYALFFIPKDKAIKNNGAFFDNPWCIRLSGNPEGKPEYITDAIRSFEIKHNVKSWDEIAISYETNGLYYP